MWISRARLPVPASWLSVLMRAVSPLWFFFFILWGLRNYIAAVIEAQLLLHLRLKVTAEEGCQARQAPGGASHFEGGWGSSMHLGKGKEECFEEQNVILSKLPHVLMRGLFFFPVIENKCDWRRVRGAFELPSIMLALWESYLSLQLTHRRAEPWSRSKLDQNCQSTTHRADVGGSPCRDSTVTYSSITSYCLDFLDSY